MHPLPPHHPGLGGWDLVGGGGEWKPKGGFQCFSSVAIVLIAVAAAIRTFFGTFCSQQHTVNFLREPPSVWEVSGHKYTALLPVDQPDQPDQGQNPSKTNGRGPAGYKQSAGAGWGTGAALRGSAVSEKGEVHLCSCLCCIHLLCAQRAYLSCIHTLPLVHTASACGALPCQLLSCLHAVCHACLNMLSAHAAL